MSALSHKAPPFWLKVLLERAKLVKSWQENSLERLPVAGWWSLKEFENGYMHLFNQTNARF